MTRHLRVLLAASILMTGSACAPFADAGSPAVLQRIADGEYDVGIKPPSKRVRYVMLVEDGEETLALTNRPIGTGADPGVPQRADRVLTPCAEAAGNWYRHTPAGYVCVGEGG